MVPYLKPEENKSFFLFFENLSFSFNVDESKENSEAASLGVLGWK